MLNVYPEGMSGRERMDYIKRKAAEYETLKGTWKQAIAQVGKINVLLSKIIFNLKMLF